MSKSKYNVINPDDICEDYGADTLRLYEMFLGPLEQAKPWNTAGITGTYSFLKKYWNLFHRSGSFKVSQDKPSNESLKVLHKTIRKVEDDINNFSFNTSVSALTEVLKEKLLISSSTFLIVLCKTFKLSLDGLSWLTLKLPDLWKRFQYFFKNEYVPVIPAVFQGLACSRGPKNISYNLSVSAP